MKTATIPALRVDPALRQAAEDVLQAGESLSSFIEQSVRANIERRRQQQAFIARGLTARDEARESGDYLAASDVLQELDDMLADAERKAAR
ncbi:MAG: YlcI/YnfO family protein [Chitinivorax sp.]